MEKVSLNEFKDCIVDEKNNIVAEKPRWFDRHNWEQGEMLVDAFNKKLNLANVGISLPKKNTGEMWSFLLVNALRCLTEEQRASLCFDLYCRNELTESIDERIRKLKEERQ